MSIKRNIVSKFCALASKRVYDTCRVVFERSFECRVEIKMSSPRKLARSGSLHTFAIVLALAALNSAASAQDIYDWFNTAPDGNWKQGAGGARWTGGLWDEPPSGRILRFNNDNQLTMNNNITGYTYSVHQIIFGSSSTQSRSIGGNAINVNDWGGADPKIENQSSASHTISLNLTGDSNDPLQLNPASGALTFSGTINNSGSWIEVYGANSKTLTLSGIVSGNGGLAVKQNSTVVLAAAHTYSGGNSVEAGTLQFGNGGTAGSSANSSISVSSSATVLFNRSDSPSFANAVSATGASGNITLGVANTRTTTLTGAITSSGAELWIGNGSNGGTLVINRSANAFTPNIVINGGVLETPDINTKANNQSLGKGNVYIGSATLRYSGSGAATTDKLTSFALQGSGTSTVIDVSNATGSLTISSAIGNNGAGKGFTKAGSGALILTADNGAAATGTGFDGAVSVSAGVLNVQAARALGTTGGGVTVANGAALQIQGAITIGAEALGLSGTGLSNDGALRNISGNNTYQGAITLNAATRINSDAGTLTLDVASGNAIAGTHNLTFGGSGNVTIADPIATSTGTLTKDGSGVLTLSAANTYSGVTTVSNGTLTLSGNGSFANTTQITLASGVGLNVSAPTTPLTLGAGQSLRAAATGANTTATITVANTKNLTLSSGGLAFTAYGSSTTAPLTVAGTGGSLALNSAPVTVTTTTELATGTYKLIAASGSATVTGTPGTLTVGGSGIAAGATATLAVTGNELIMTVAMAPSVTSSAATSITTTGATLNGEVTNQNGATVSERGFFYKTSATVTTNDTKLTVAGTTGTFSNTPTNLSVNTQYFYRAFASNVRGTTLSSTEQSFWTLANTPSAPTVDTPTATTLNVTVNENGNPASTQFSIRVGASQYVQANGTLNTTEVWQTDAQWGTTTVTGLANSTSYSFVVRARNGASTATTDSAATSLSTAASATAPVVSTAAAASIAQTTATLNGNVTADGGASVTARGFVYSATQATPTIGAGGVTQVTNSGTTGAFSNAITGLTTNTAYNFRAYASNSVGLTYGSVTNFTTLPNAPSAPAAPTGSSVTTDSFTASWTAVSGATNYSIDVSTASNFATFVSGYSNLAVATTNQAVTGLTAGTTYYVRVRAANAGGTSGDSPTLTQITVPTAPAAPTSASVATTSFTVNWVAVTGAASYRLDVSTASNFGAGTFVTNFENKTISSGTSDSVTGLTAGTTYYVRVRAVNSAGGTSANSASLTQITLPAAPGTPSAASITTTGFTASWSAVTGAASYRLDVSTASNFGAGTFVTNFENKTISSGTSDSVTGLTAGTTYYVRVRAVNSAGGTSANSGTLTQITVPNAPGTPTSSSVLPYSFTAAWPPATGASSYRLDASTNSGFTTFISGFSNQTVAVTNLSITGLSSGTTNFVRVRAVNDGGTSTNSSTLTVVTPQVPGGNNPTNANSTNSFLGDTVSLTVRSWQTFNGAARSFATVFGRYGNSNLTTGTVEGEGVLDPGPGSDNTTASTARFTNTGTFHWAMRISYGSGTNYWFDAPRSGWSDLGLSAPTNSPLTIAISALNNPTSLTATAASSSSINLGWVQGVSGNAKNTMIVRSTDTNFTAPTQGTSYSVGSTALGGDTVVHNAGGTNFTDTGLAAGTTYHYRFYAENFSYYSAGADTSVATTGTPTISTTGTLSALSTTYGTASSSTSFNVSGANMAAGITITPPSGFEVSTSSTFASNIGTSSSPITVGAAGTIASTTIHVRLSSSTSAGAKSGNIVLTSSGASNVNVATAASTVSQKNLDITVGSQTVIFGFPRTGTPSVVASGSYSVDATDLVNNDATSVVTGTASYSTTYLQGDAAGTAGRTITVSELSATNYNLVIAPGTVTVAALGNPTSFAATKQSDTQINTAWSRFSTNSSTFNVMLVRREGGAVTLTPSNGVAYTNDQVVSGNTVLLGSAAQDAMTNTGLTANTTYHYRIFSENWGYYSTGATASATTDPPPPSLTASTNALVSFGNVYVGTNSTNQSYTIAGANLTNNITVSAPTDFQISTNASSGFTNALTLTPASGTVAATPVFVRFAPLTSGSKSGTITNASGGATSRTLTVSGNALVPPQGLNPTPANATSAFLGDNLSLSVNTWTNWNSNARSFAVLFSRFGNSNLTTGATETTNSNPGSSADLFSITTPRFSSTGTFFWAMRVSYQAGNDFWFDASRPTWADLSRSAPTNSTLSVEVNALNNPAITSVTATTNSVTLNFTRGTSGNAKDTVIVRREGSAVATDPTQGTAYNENNALGAGTVLYRGADTTFTDNSRVPGTTYHYKLYAENWSYYSPGVTTNITTVPNAPSAPSGSDVAATSFTANWAAVTGASDYRLDVSTATNFSANLAGYNNLTVAGTNQAITGLTANTTYYVRVRAVSSGGASANSATLTQLTAPAAPAAPTASSVLATSFTANWSSVGGAASYRLDVDDNADFSSPLSSHNNKTVAGTSDAVTGLTAGTTYYVRVRAVNSNGTFSAYSPSLTVATAASATAPSISTITAGNGELTVAFTAGESGGLTITNYQYSTDNGSNYTAVSPASTNSPIVITGLTNGTSYTVRIRAVNSDASFGTASAGVSSTPRTTPSAPTITGITAGNAELLVTFTAGSNGGSAITSYEYSTDGGTSYKTASGTSSPITISTVSDSSSALANGTPYSVRLRALNAAGTGTASEATSATPRTSPTVTTGASSSVGANGATLAGNITATGGANATSRGFEYSTNNNFATGTGTQSSTAGDFSTGAFTNTVSGLASATTYYYRAFASNVAGVSYGAQSNFTTVTVPGGRDPDTANATTAFLGDTVPLSINAWKTFNGANRSFGTVFGRFGNANLTAGTSESSTNGVSPEVDQFSVNTPRLTNTGTFYWAIRVSWGAGTNYWFDAPRSGWSDLGLTAPTNSPLSIEVSALNNPTSVTATNSGASQINLTWAKGVSGNAKNTMIVRSTDTNFTAPTQGTAYTVGSTALGGDTVVYNDGGTNFPDTSLSASTTYYYRLYAENWNYYSAGTNASATTAAPSPSVSVSGTPAVMTANYGVASTASQFSVSGANLSANVSVAAPAGFEVSTAIGSGYASSVTLTPSSGTVNSTTIYVRLKSNATPGANSDNVTVDSTGASSQSVAVSGTVNIATMTMTVASPAGTMNADYNTSKLFADEVAGTSNSITITFSPGVTPDEVEVVTNLNNRDRADNDVLGNGGTPGDGIPDGIVPPAPDKPVGYTSGVYPSNGYFQAHPMSGSGGTYTLTLNASKTGAYRLSARYRMNGGPWVDYKDALNGLGINNRDHAITVTPVLARNMQVYEINTLNVNATGSTFETRSTFESLTNSTNGRVNLDYLRNLGVNTLWFQPVHPNGISGREPSGGWNSSTSPYDPGSPYSVKNFFEVMEVMSQGNTRAASMTAFTNFVAAADTKGVHVMLDAPFNHTAYDVEIGQKGIELFAAAGLNTSGWSATDEIRNREARFFSHDGSGGQTNYARPASSAGNIAVAPDRTDFGKWRDVADVFFGRYAALVTGLPAGNTNFYGESRTIASSTADTINLDDLQGTGGINSQTAAVTRAVWQYFAAYVPHWLEKTGLPANSSLAEQATKGIDGLRADFGQGMPPQFWEYAINVAREHKWSFVFMSESLDGGQVTYRSNRHFDILNENIVPNWKDATTTSAHRNIFEDRRNAGAGGATVNNNAGYGQGLVLLNNTSHDEVGYDNPWEAFIRYAVGSTIDGAPMIMYGQEIGTGIGTGANEGSFDWFEYNFEKWIPHFKRWNSMQKQWTAWGTNSFGVRNLMPNYSGVGLAREFSAALRSSHRYFLDATSGGADPDIFAVAKYETPNASPATSDVVLAFVNLKRNSAEANTFAIPSNLGTLLGIEPNQLYNVKNIAAYLGPNNELPNRRSEFLWPTPRLGSDIISNGIYVGLNAVPSTDGGWTNAPYEAQYLKVYVAPGLTTGGSPSALTTIYGSASTNTSFTLSANNVHDGVTVTAPAGFQVSTNASSGFASSFSFTNTGTIGATTVFARLAATNPVGTYSGNVTIASPGGTNRTVALAASTVTAKALTISGATAIGRAFNGTNTVTVSGGSLVGVVGADAVTLGGSPAGTMANANAGTNKAVTVTGYSISGGSAGNYTITQPTGVTVTITPATPTIATAPTATAITEGQALSVSTLSGGSVTGLGGASVNGEFTFTSPNTVPAVGTANQSVTFTPSDANYGPATGLASVTVNPAAPPLTSVGAKFSVSTNGVYTVVDSNNLPIEGATFTYLYTGRTNGVTGLNTNYAFMSYSNTNAPSQPGFYNVTATAGGAYTGTVTEDYGIAGPLHRTINLTRTAGTATNSFSRALLMSNVQRVSTNFSVLTGATGLSWTNAVPDVSTMQNGATNANTVTIVTTNTMRLIPANSNSVNDTFGITISDGATPIAFPVIVTTTNAQSVPTLTAQRVVTTSVIITNYDVNGVPTSFITNQAKRVIFMARPGRTINVSFMDGTNGMRPITQTNVAFISPTNQPSTNQLTGDNQTYHKPVNFAPPTGVLELMVDPSVQFYMGRPTNVPTR